MDHRRRRPTNRRSGTRRIPPSKVVGRSLLSLTLNLKNWIVPIAAGRVKLKIKVNVTEGVS